MYNFEKFTHPQMKLEKNYWLVNVVNQIRRFGSRRLEFELKLLETFFGDSPLLQIVLLPSCGTICASRHLRRRVAVLELPVDAELGRLGSLCVKHEMANDTPDESPTCGMHVCQGFKALQRLTRQFHVHVHVSSMKAIRSPKEV